MQLPQIRMQSQMAKIEITQLPGKINIEQRKADVSIEQPHAEVTIRSTPGKLTIDQSQAWEDMNLMSTPRLIETKGQEAYAIASEGTGRRAEQGDQIMKIENDGEPLINQAIINGHDQMKFIGIKYIPSPFSVNIQYEPGELHLSAQANKPVIHVQANKPELTYDHGSIAIGIRQYAELDINFINLFSETI